MTLNINTRLKYILKIQQPRLDLTSLDFAKLSTTKPGLRVMRVLRDLRVLGGFENF